MSRFATNTDVPVERSRSEIEGTLRRYGCDDIVVGQSVRTRRAFVQFFYRKLHLEVSITLPDAAAERFRLTPSKRRRRTERDATAEWEKECRQQWRILLLLLKAQLEAVENGIMQPWEAFLPWLCLPDGDTVGKRMAGGIAELLASGKVPPMLAFTEAQK
jgi:hypothetical protein